MSVNEVSESSSTQLPSVIHCFPGSHSFLLHSGFITTHLNQGKANGVEDKWSARSTEGPKASGSNPSALSSQPIYKNLPQ